jgi:SAM-dependent methyltransferase
MAYRDLFSWQASLYAQYRPHYPPELFAFLSSHTLGRETAWDCATGNGQAAVGLAEHFQRVVATDGSLEQLSHASPHPRVFYARSLAERASIASHSLDLVTVAQGVHWFNFDQFYQEARRVLKPGGVLAVWGYGLIRVTPEIDAIVDRFYTETVGPYWDERRILVDEGYRTLPFPFNEFQSPQIEMRSQWKLEGLVGMLMSWSAVQKYKQVHGDDPLSGIADELVNAWEDPSIEREVRWPVFMRIGRI